MHAHRSLPLAIAFLAFGCLCAPGVSFAEGEAAQDSSLVLEGGDEETDLKSLTIEAENRMQIRFERPVLRIDVDPATAPGLDWGSPLDVVQRADVDLRSPLLASSAGLESPYVGRPWLGAFRQGAVARFRPQLDNVERWRLVIADAQGNEVKTFEGKGRPPEEISWDGRTDDGGLASPGLVHSYVLEAHDRAGNRRNFVGDSFELPPFRAGGLEAPRMIFAGKHLAAAEEVAGVPSLVLEAASWVNQVPDVTRPVRVTVEARTIGEAERLSQGLARMLADEVIGGARRVMAFARVAEDAPETGGITITALP